MSLSGVVCTDASVDATVTGGRLTAASEDDDDDVDVEEDAGELPLDLSCRRATSTVDVLSTSSSTPRQHTADLRRRYSPDATNERVPKIIINDARVVKLDKKVKVAHTRLPSVGFRS